jgi:hypothetical protein
MVDKLPHTTRWSHDLITVTSNTRDENGEFIVEILELYRCNPIECIRELIGNPTFNSHIKYASKRITRDKDGHIRVYDEMWTGDWWWGVQVCLQFLR